MWGSLREVSAGSFANSSRAANVSARGTFEFKLLVAIARLYFFSSSLSSSPGASFNTLLAGLVTMSSSQFGSSLSVFLGISGVISAAFQESSHAKDERHFLMTLNQRSYRQRLPFDEPIFDPTFVVSLLLLICSSSSHPFESNEIRGVTSKYEQASRFFEGIDINTTTVLPPIPPVIVSKHLMTLTDHHDRSMDLLYYGTLSVGTPSQTLNVQLDTGSADLWLPANCPDCVGNQFKPEDSQTYKSTDIPFQESYASRPQSSYILL
jgi:Eukaryotic aspartyl protease